ncbi:hypothetical protein JD844_022825 [Phrynosoma platyrhinos]|uniref:Uncharacterized protein n=1 Tax=Phrynosoma platyrhinos TaxID=52577 RepID=A0ABQ7SVV8_PHRPL|nr:hypothetical protein JD844_022825 [Phrynosoma platyrhinos]
MHSQFFLPPEEWPFRAEFLPLTSFGAMPPHLYLQLSPYMLALPQTAPAAFPIEKQQAHNVTSAAVNKGQMSDFIHLGSSRRLWKFLEDSKLQDGKKNQTSKAYRITELEKILEVNLIQCRLCTVAFVPASLWGKEGEQRGEDKEGNTAKKPESAAAASIIFTVPSSTTLAATTTTTTASGVADLWLCLATVLSPRYSWDH